MSLLDRFRYKPRPKQVAKSPTFSGPSLSASSQDSDVTCIPESPTSSSSHRRFSVASPASQSPRRGLNSQADSSQNSPTFYPDAASRPGGGGGIHRQVHRASPSLPVSGIQYSSQKTQNSGDPHGAPRQFQGPSPNQPARRLQYPTQRVKLQTVIHNGAGSHGVQSPGSSPVPKAIHRAMSPAQMPQGQKTLPQGVVAYGGDVRRSFSSSQPVRRVQQSTYRQQTSSQDPGGSYNSSSGQVPCGYLNQPVPRAQNHTVRNQVQAANITCVPGSRRHKQAFSSNSNQAVHRTQNLSQRSRSQDSIRNGGAVARRMQRHNSYPSQAMLGQGSHATVGNSEGQSGRGGRFMQSSNKIRSVQCFQNQNPAQRSPTFEGNRTAAIHTSTQRQLQRSSLNQSTQRTRCPSQRAQYSGGTPSHNIHRQSLGSSPNQAAGRAPNQPAANRTPYHGQRSQSSPSDSDETYVSGLGSQITHDINMKQYKDVGMQGVSTVADDNDEVETIPDSDEDEVSIIEEEPKPIPQKVVQLSPITITNVVSGHAVTYPPPSHGRNVPLGREKVRRSLHPRIQGNPICGSNPRIVDSSVMGKSQVAPAEQAVEVEDLSDIEEIVDEPEGDRSWQPSGMYQCQAPRMALGRQTGAQEEESFSDIEEIVDEPEQGKFVDQADTYDAREDYIEEVHDAGNDFGQGQEFDEQAEAYNEHANDLEQVERYDELGNVIEQVATYNDQDNEFGPSFEQQEDLEEVQAFDGPYNDLEQAEMYDEQGNYVEHEQGSGQYYEQENDLEQVENHDEQQQFLDQVEPSDDQVNYVEQDDTCYVEGDHIEQVQGNHDQGNSIEQADLYEEAETDFEQAYNDHEDDLQPDTTYEQHNDVQQVYTHQPRNHLQQAQAPGPQNGFQQVRTHHQQNQFQQFPPHPQQNDLQQVQNSQQQLHLQQAPARYGQYTGFRQAQRTQEKNRRKGQTKSRQSALHYVQTTLQVQTIRNHSQQGQTVNHQHVLQQVHTTQQVQTNQSHSQHGQASSQQNGLQQVQKTLIQSQQVQVLRQQNGLQQVGTKQQRNHSQPAQTYSRQTGLQLIAKTQQRNNFQRVQKQGRRNGLQQVWRTPQQNSLQQGQRGHVQANQLHPVVNCNLEQNGIGQDDDTYYEGDILVENEASTEKSSTMPRNEPGEAAREATSPVDRTEDQLTQEAVNYVVDTDDETCVTESAAPPENKHRGEADMREAGNSNETRVQKGEPVGKFRPLQWSRPKRVLSGRDIKSLVEELRMVPRDEHRRVAKEDVQYLELTELAEDQRRQLVEMFPSHSKKDLRRAIEQCDGSLSIAASVLVDLPASQENSEDDDEEFPDPFSPSKQDQQEKMPSVNVVSDDDDESGCHNSSMGTTSQETEQTPDMVRPSRRRKRILYSEGEGDSGSDSSGDCPPSKQRRADPLRSPSSTSSTANKGTKSLLSKFAYNGGWVSKNSYKEQKPSPRKILKATPKKVPSGSAEKGGTPLKKRKGTGRSRRKMVSSDEDEYEEDFVVQDDTLSEGEKSEEEEEEAALSSEDEDRGEDYYGSDQFSQSFQTEVLEFFNSAPRQELENLGGCSRTKAQRIMEIRPFQNFNDVVEKMESTKSLGSYLIENCEDLFGERKLLSEILDDCSGIANKIQSALAKEDEFLDKDDQMAFLDSSLSLKPYQLVGVNWMKLLHKHKINGILADEMGLGKTIQVIAFLASLLEEGNEGPHLVVAPSSTLDNWMREFNKWAPFIEAILYTGDRDYRMQLAEEIRYGELTCNVLITSYNIATGEQDYKNFFRKLKLQYSVYDEGHMLKNIKSLRFKSLMKIKSQQKLLLTGTPLQNNLLELMSLISFVVPKLDSPEKMQTLQRIFSKVTGGDESSFVQDRIRQAKQIMQPFVLRRVKDQVLEQLPEKIIKVEVCPMVPRQEGYYQNLKASYQRSQQLQEVVGKRPGDKTTVGALMELRKLANHPLLMRRLYTDEKLAEMSKLMLREPTHHDANPDLIHEDMSVMSDYELHLLCKQYAAISEYRLGEERIRESGKFKALDRILPKLKEQGLKVLVFSQFTMMLDILEPYMKLCKHTYLRMDGSTSVVERGEIMDKFINDPDIFVFLLSTKACGLGINLTIANTVILHDIDFNPHNDKQAEDRCHRLGQTRNVTVIKLVSQGTIDESMLQRAGQKLHLERQMISGENVDGEEKVSIDALLKQALDI